MLSWNKKQNKAKQEKNQEWKSAAGKVKLFIYYDRACDTLVIRMDHILVSNSAK